MKSDKVLVLKGAGLGSDLQAEAGEIFQVVPEQPSLFDWLHALWSSIISGGGCRSSHCKSVSFFSPSVRM